MSRSLTNTWHLRQPESTLDDVERLVQMHLVRVEEHAHPVQGLEVLLMLRQGLVRDVDRWGGVGAAHVRARAVGFRSVGRPVRVEPVVGSVHVVARRIPNWRDQTVTWGVVGAKGAWFMARGGDGGGEEAPRSKCEFFRGNAKWFCLEEASALAFSRFTVSYIASEFRIVSFFLVRWLCRLCVMLHTVRRFRSETSHITFIIVWKCKLDVRVS